MQTQDVVELLKDEGRREGEREGEKKMLLRLYRTRFGTVPPEVEAAVKQEQGEATLMAWLDLFATKSADEIIAGLTQGKSR